MHKIQEKSVVVPLITPDWGGLLHLALGAQSGGYCRAVIYKDHSFRRY